MEAVSGTFVFRRAARSEYDAAGDWYEQRRDGLGAAFTEAVQKVLDRIEIWHRYGFSLKFSKKVL